MVRLFLFWILTYTPAHGFFETDLPEGQEAVHGLRQLEEKGARTGGLACRAANPELFTPAEVPLKLKTADLKNVDSFCQALQKGCEQRYGFTRVGLCLNYSTIRKRVLEDRQTILKVREVALKKFSGWVEDPKFIDRCCGSDQKCSGVLSKVKLTFWDPEFKGKDIARFDRKTNQVIILDGILATCPGAGCVEEALLHELGHACQYAHYSTTLDFGERLTGTCMGDPILSWKGFTKLLGQPVKDCVQLQVLRQLDTFKDRCADSWVEEAAASLVFSPVSRSALQWTRICESQKPDRLHPAMRPLLECLLQQSSFVKNVTK